MVQSGAKEGVGDDSSEPMSEPGQQGTGWDERMPTAQVRQDLGVWAWIEINPPYACVE